MSQGAPLLRSPPACPGTRLLELAELESYLLSNTDDVRKQPATTTAFACADTNRSYLPHQQQHLHLQPQQQPVGRLFQPQRFLDRQPQPPPQDQRPAFLSSSPLERQQLDDTAPPPQGAASGENQTMDSEPDGHGDADEDADEDSDNSDASSSKRLCATPSTTADTASQHGSDVDVVQRRRRPKRLTPSSEKTPEYWEKRKLNNERARRSKEKRKQAERALAQQLEDADTRRTQLLQEVALLRGHVAKLRRVAVLRCVAAVASARKKQALAQANAEAQARAHAFAVAQARAQHAAVQQWLAITATASPASSASASASAPVPVPVPAPHALAVTPSS